MYDVIIVGAGPTGSIASLMCKRYGFNTLILEKKKLPRRKPCGGSISKKGLELLENLNIPLPPSLIKNEVSGVRVHKPDGTNFLTDVQRPISVLVLRKDFDFFLVKKAKEEGVELIENSEVSNVSVNRNIVNVDTKNGENFSSKVIIGADGAMGIVAKSIGIRKRWNPERSGLCLEAEPQVSEKTISEWFGDKTYLEVYFGVVGGGYAWVFPKHDCISIGIGGQRNKLNKLGQTFKKFCERFPFIEYEKLDVAGHLIPAGGVKRQIISDNVILAGDAAGFVDTFIGEGIYYAMKSGILAAQTISDAAKNNDFSTKQLSNYQNLCWKSFGSDLKTSLKFYLRFHSNCNFYLSILENDKKSQECFLEVSEGKKTYKQFCRKLYSRLLLSLIRMAIRKSKN